MAVQEATQVHQVLLSMLNCGERQRYVRISMRFLAESSEHPYHINPLQMTVLEAYQVLIVLAQYVNTDPFTSASDKTTLFLSALVRAGVPKKS